MNMASMHILLIVTVIYTIIGNAKMEFVNVECKAEKVGQYGQQSLLECVVKTSQDDTQIRVVTWKKKGVQSPLLVFYKGSTEQQPGYSFAEPSWNVKNKNVSLLITNTAREHEGVYNCMVLTDRGEGSNNTSLRITAKYNKPTIRSNPENITPNTKGTLMCDSDGGYPQGQLRWFAEHNTEMTEKSQMEVKLTKSGLFHLSSKLTLLQGSSFSKYTCVVFNASGGKEEETIFEVLDQPKAGGRGQEQGKSDPTSKIVAPVVVIGSLIAGLLLVLLFYYRRRIQRDHHGVRTCESDVEEGDHQEIDKTYQDSVA